MTSLGGETHHHVKALRHFEHIIIIPVSGIRQIQKNINSGTKLNFFISSFPFLWKRCHVFFLKALKKVLTHFFVLKPASFWRYSIHENSSSSYGK